MLFIIDLGDYIKITELIGGKRKTATRKCTALEIQEAIIRYIKSCFYNSNGNKEVALVWFESLKSVLDTTGVNVSCEEIGIGLNQLIEQGRIRVTRLEFKESNGFFEVYFVTISLSC